MSISRNHHVQLVGAMLAVMGLGLVACGWTDVQEQAAEPPPAPPAEVAKPAVPLPVPAFVANGQSAIADVTAQALPSVVNIFATRVQRVDAMRQHHPFFNDPMFRRFFGVPDGQPLERRQQGLGSGVIVSADGIVVTNNHVVEGAEEIRVSLTDEREFDAELVGTDPKADIAVLRLKGELQGLTPLKLADSDRLRLGDIVLAIGNPFGVGQTVTMGIVSAKGRANMGIVDYEDFIQTDAAINPGNSGGALVNLEGELVGINTAILSRTGGNQGIGFAIPTNMVKPIMQSLIEHGKVMRGWLGVSIQDVDDTLAQAMKLEVDRGVLIADVMAGSPAAEGGLKRGDVVLKLDGAEVATTSRLRNLVAAAGAGKRIALDLLRDGERMTLQIELGELPAAGAGNVASAAGGPGELGGLTLAPVDAGLRERFELEASVAGLVVVQVEAGTAAQRAGLQPGDVIVEMNREPVRSVADARRIYRAAGERVLLWVQRGGGRLFIVLPK